MEKSLQELLPCFTRSIVIIWVLKVLQMTDTGLI